MRKANKIIMMTVSILLSLVLITGSVISGTLAKYATSTDQSTEARVAKWGISITPSSDLSNTYGTIEDGGEGIKIVSSTSGNVLAPGTKGALAAFHIKGTPEVRYDINFTGNIAIGDGYKASSCFVSDEEGRCIDYFPIILYLCKVDLDDNDQPIAGSKTFLSKHCVVRLSPDAPAGVTTSRNDDSSDTIVDGEYKNDVYRYSFFDSVMWSSISVMQSQLNTDEKYLNSQFDHMGEASEKINSIYTVEWDWPYSNQSEYAGDESRNGNYQTAELDTQLGEAMAKNQGTGLFDIQLDMSVVIGQIQVDDT